MIRADGTAYDFEREILDAESVYPGPLPEEELPTPAELAEMAAVEPSAPTS